MRVYKANYPSHFTLFFSHQSSLFPPQMRVLEHFQSRFSKSPPKRFGFSVWGMLFLHAVFGGRRCSVMFPKCAPQISSCVNDASGPPLPASLLSLSGVPGASPVERGRARDAGHRIGPPRTERAFGTRDWGR
jgi:hypothetical protein